ncbi:hypothetical protein K1719_028646 [Acacia pycnantha]|nr:hypothetical protein K1719_041645 [Acacia pycnantha]KAI9090793.1 hypothetical protein K1719_028646 [Acacia pycnantha]
MLTELEGEEGEGTDSQEKKLSEPRVRITHLQGRLRHPPSRKGKDIESPTDDHGHSSEDRDRPLSISVEYTGPNTDYYSDEMQNHVNTIGNAETAQDLLGLTVFLMLIFSPLYNRMESPSGDPIAPLFTLNSMYVSNFTTVNGTLSATWDAKLTVANANVSSIYFRYTDFILFYDNNPEDAVSGVSLNPFSVEKGEAVKLHLKLTTSGGAWDENGPRVESWLVEQIGRDREKDGAVKFGMQMRVEAVYYGETWVADVEMSPHCEGLRVQFLAKKGSGRLTQTDRNFSVPIGWKPSSLF